MSPPADTLPFDPRPLTEPVDRAAARAFARELRASGRAPRLFGSVLTMVLFAVVGAGFLLVFGTAAVGVVTGLLGAILHSGSGTAVLPALLPLLVIAVVLTIVIVIVVRGFGSRAIRWYRLDRFARANGMSYLPRLHQPALPGMIFSLGSDRTATDLVRGERPRFVEFANYRYVTGSGKNRTTHSWGYVAVKLDVPLPHIVLDATSNNGLFGGSNLPASFDRDQRLSLEGDFDKHFALYCPAGYERDALYLFTPDIMARFIDNAAALDVEIVDDWLFLYAKRDFSTLDPATWAWLFSTVGALLDKFAQWARWRDERLAAVAQAAGPTRVDAASPLPFAAPGGALTPPPGVAPQGRRLSRRIPWVTFVVAGAFVVFWVLMQSGMLGALFR